MSENRKDPRCPYCGSEMNENLFAYGNGGGWCNFECPNCGATSPKKENSESCNKAEFAAYFVAKKRWQEPNRVLTLEEVTADTEKEDWSFMWIERKYDEKYALQYCGWYATDTWVILVLPADEKKIYELKSDYGKTWRCWLRKPTLEEMAETPWGAKHNEH